MLLLTYRTVQAEQAHRNQVESTLAVLDDLRSVGIAVLNGETGQRGYMLTLDRRYLAPFESGRLLIGPALDRLHAAQDRPDMTARQRQLIDEIDALARSKFDEMEGSVALVHSGNLLEARRQVLSDEGQETMERLRRAIREMEVSETAVLRRASDTAGINERLILPMLSALLLLLLLAVAGGGRLLAATARAEAEAAQAAALTEARDRADLLARELNHRVKNLFSVVLAIVQMTARNKPEAKEVVASIAQRIHALLTAHEVTQGDLHNPVGALHTLIETTLAPYHSPEHRYTLDGPEVLLPAKNVTPLGLVLHELTTNSVKYGAWAHSGTIAIVWSLAEGALDLTWCEDGLTNDREPATRGFGSLLMTSAARQLGGTIERRFEPGRLVVTMHFPVA